MPGYRFAVAGVTENLEPEDPVFLALLPGSRHPGEQKEDSIACGLFLEGVAAFIDEHLDVLHAFCGERPQDILISLEKHGALYHPCKIFVNGNAEKPLVVNAAIREQTSRVLKKEIEALGRLASKKIPHIPRVLASGEVSCAKRVLSLFLAPWFLDFYEFHWSGDSSNPKMKVWEDGGKKTVLSDENTKILLSKTTQILAAAYDAKDFSQIFPWHHAAGDFVVKLEAMNVSEVRLISVRQYESMMGLSSEEASFGDILDGLLYFFLNTVLRMRVDRLDGIGDLFFAPDFVLPSVLEGFFRGLAENPTLVDDFSVILEILPEILRQMDAETLLSMHGELLESYHPEAPELGLLKREVASHNRELHRLFSENCFFSEEESRSK